MISEELLKTKNLFGYDLNITVIPGNSSDIMLLFHGYGGDFRVAEHVKSGGAVQDTLISFNFPDHSIKREGICPEDTSFGSVDELLPPLFILKKCVVDMSLEKINLYGFSAGGAAVINTIGILNSSTYDQDLQKVGITASDKEKILAAIEKGQVILDVPLKSIEEIMDFRGSSHELEVIAARYKQNNLRPIDSIEKLQGLTLNITVYFQDPDGTLSNRDDALFIERLKKYNHGITDVIIGKQGELHNSYHRALFNFYREKTANPQIVTSQQVSLADDLLYIEVKDLTPLEIVEVKAHTTDSEGEIWESHAILRVNEEGSLKLNEQAAIEGTYEGVDPMGLFWSIEPTSSRFKLFKTEDDKMVYTFQVFRKEKCIATKEIVRLKNALNVEKITVNEEGIKGSLFLPQSDKPLPAIITLSGSNGGISETRAKALAAHGYAVLALGYFGIEGLPSNLENIPLEYFEKAIGWMKNQSAIDANRIGLFGASRGAELSLILGSFFPSSFKAIVATAPSSVIYSGLETKTSAWTYNGKPIGSYLTVEKVKPKKNEGRNESLPITTASYFLKGMQNKKAFEEALIPVENIQCPLLIISGGDDRMWPSSLFAKQIKKRLKEKGSSIDCIHLDYPKAGHQINVPYLPSSPVYFHPIGKLWFSMGGSPKEDEFASRDSWEKLLNFFNQNL